MVEVHLHRGETTCDYNRRYDVYLYLTRSATPVHRVPLHCIGDLQDSCKSVYFYVLQCTHKIVSHKGTQEGACCCARELHDILPYQILDISFAHDKQVNTGEASSMIPYAEEHNHDTRFSGVADAHGERGYINSPLHTSFAHNTTCFALLRCPGVLSQLMSHLLFDSPGNPQIDFHATALRCHYGSRAGHLHR